MKILIYSALALTMLSGITSCSNDTETIDPNNDVWAELVESKTVLLKPEGWDDEYWNSVNKNVNRQQIFTTIVNEVLSGKQKAYNILTDELLTVEQVKEMLDNVQMNDAGEMASEKVKPEDLSTIRMREKWVFDKTNFKLHKHVTRIDLLLKKLDLDGTYLGDKALFYVKLED